MPGPDFIEGDRVVLRTIEEEDIEFLQDGMNDPQVWKAIGNTTPYNRNQEREFFENIVSTGESVHLLIVTDGTPIGTIGIEQIDQTGGC